MTITTGCFYEHTSNSSGVKSSTPQTPNSMIKGIKRFSITRSHKLFCTLTLTTLLSLPCHAIGLASASSSNGSQTPDKALNGLTGWGNQWRSTANPSTSSTEYWQVDLGESQNVEEIEFGTVYSRLLFYTVETSNDGTAWTTIADRTSAGVLCGATDLLSESVNTTTQFIRITFTGSETLSGAAERADIEEFALTARTVAEENLPAVSADLKFPMYFGGEFEGLSSLAGELEPLSKSEITAILEGIRDNFDCTIARVCIVTEQSPNEVTFNDFSCYWKDGRKTNWIRNELVRLGFKLHASPLGTPGPRYPVWLTPGTLYQDNWADWIGGYITKAWPKHVSPFNESGGGNDFTINVTTALRNNYAANVNYVGPDINTLMGTYNKISKNSTVEAVFDTYGAHDKKNTITYAAEWQAFQDLSPKEVWATESGKGPTTGAIDSIQQAADGNADVITLYKTFPAFIDGTGELTDLGEMALDAMGY